MDADRFDALTRAMTRRGIASTLTGLALVAVLPSFQTDSVQAKKKKKKKKTCPPCRRKKKGKCKRKRPDLTSCNGDGQCFAGECVSRPDCLSTGSSCGGTAEECCSVCFLVGPGIGNCLSGEAGDPCLVASDCPAPLACIAYRCR